jgi:hypothetical protein
MNAECPGCRLMLFSGQPEIAELLEASAKEGYSFDMSAKPVHPTTLPNGQYYRTLPQILPNLLRKFLHERLVDV